MGTKSTLVHQYLSSTRVKLNFFSTRIILARHIKPLKDKNKLKFYFY